MKTEPRVSTTKGLYGRGKGRPPKPHRAIYFKLAEGLADWLDEAAASTGRKKTAIVEEALDMLRKRWERSPPA